jgi:hypothetical protein
VTLRAHYYQLARQLQAVTAVRVPLCSTGTITCGPEGDDAPEGWALVTDDGNELTRLVLLTRDVDSSLIDYYVALHELGHIAQHCVDGKWRKRNKFTDAEEIAAEVDAWQWALKNALVQPTPEVYAAIFERFVTYLTPEGYRFLQDIERKAANHGNHA